MSDTPELGEGEEILTSSDELLWRNINPDWFQNGHMTSQAFRPTPKDNKRLSCARADCVTAEAHFTEFTGDFGLESAGVWAVKVGETAEHKVSAVYDEQSVDAPSPCPAGHTYLDFTAISGGQAKRIGGRLRDKAEERGQQHP